MTWKKIHFTDVGIWGVNIVVAVNVSWDFIAQRVSKNSCAGDLSVVF